MQKNLWGHTSGSIIGPKVILLKWDVKSKPQEIWQALYAALRIPRNPYYLMSYHRSLEGISVYVVYDWRENITKVCVLVCVGDFGTVTWRQFFVLFKSSPGSFIFSYDANWSSVKPVLLIWKALIFD